LGTDIRERGHSGRIYLLVSLMLHVLVVVLFGLSGLSFRTEDAGRPDADREDRLAFEVIEVPEDIPQEKPDARTYLVSDRDSRAANRDPEIAEEAVDPYSDGEVEVRLHEVMSGEAAGAGGLEENTELRGPDEHTGMRYDDHADRGPADEIAGYSIGQGSNGRNGESGRSVDFRNLLSMVGTRDGLSFNTYNWDFAPYMLTMKRAIEKHLYPPYAFTHMGLVSGTNVVRFTVLPSGRVRGLEIMDSNAHFSLDRTSLRAVESSIPFLPLPKDFPEEYLEVTACFSYVVLGKE
jgi:TonB family protein